MMGESGISTYFRNDKIRMRHKTIEDLAYPEYIHLRINEEKKHLFIEKCDRDMDAFSIKYMQAHDCVKPRVPSAETDFNSEMIFFRERAENHRQSPLYLIQ